MDQRDRAAKRKNQNETDTGKIPRRAKYRKRKKLGLKKRKLGGSGSDSSADERKENVSSSFIENGARKNNTKDSSEAADAPYVASFLEQLIQQGMEITQETVDEDETYYNWLDVDFNWDETVFNVSKPTERDKLREILTDEEWNMPIQVPVAASKTEVLMSVLKLSLKHKWCLSETSEVLQMLNSLFVRSFLPETPYFLKEFFGNTINVDLYAVCPSCQLLVRKFEAAAIYFGKDKPDETSFTKVFVEKANDLSKNEVKCSIKNEDVVVKVFFICACMDSVARAPAQGVI
ncbi:hypothetical protein QAD02_002263 [Eretmocerus hayati]|uniref:Uncharacterized protein n=1 Tax=Eretmocerus hayati TaxID=131215 RepID=A0ACC2NID9_9HYME|nr:hypothetical protein QAD02_002263 [Eretmocerus hayati]